MGFIHTGKAFFHDLVKLFQIRIVGHADFADGQGTVSGPVLEVADIGIVNHLQVAAGILDGSGADAYVADNAPEFIQYDDIPDDVLAFKDDEGAGDDILDQALGAEAQNQSDDAHAGQHGHGIDAQNGQAPDCPDDHDQVMEGSGGQAGYGL